MNMEPDISHLRSAELDILRDTADRLFRGKKVRFAYHDADTVELPDGKIDRIASLRIILDEKISFWFFREDKEWKFDGWEMGDYSNKWLDEKL